MPNETHNARVRLVASAISNLGLAVIMIGVVTLAFSDRPLLSRGLAAAVALGIGILLHLGARKYLDRLKP
jgi:hypothetical protein